MGRRFALLVAGMLVVTAAAGCSGDDDDGGSSGSSRRTANTGAETTTTAVPDAAPAADLCAGVEPVSATPPTVAQAALVEASGLAASQLNAGILWAHNDSGGLPEVFAIGADDGSDHSRYRFDGASALDGEDMALTPRDGGTLYLGDIGDNPSNHPASAPSGDCVTVTFKVRPAITIYRVAEPDLTDTAPGTALSGVAAIEAAYADGPRDAETLLADPITGDLFVVSKYENPAGVYRVPAGSRPGARVTMERVADVALPDGEVATGGEISADGTVVAIRTYHAVLLWQRDPDQTVAEAMSAPSCQASQTDKVQGEALTLTADGRGYITLSEGQHPPINTFRLP